MKKQDAQLALVVMALSWGTPVVSEERMDPTGVAQVWVPAGKFFMGSTPEEIELVRQQDNKPSWFEYAVKHELPRRQVEITRGYWIDRYEVTNEEFQKFIDASDYTTEKYWSSEGWKWLQKNRKKVPMKAIGEARSPRCLVSWFEAEAYARWRGGSLPTEAQWEYAARGPESRTYPWGNDYRPELLNLSFSSASKPVGTFPGGASWVGALDMAGNVMEWVADWFDTDYGSLGVLVDPTGPATGTSKGEKGGWYGAPRFTARSAYCHFEDPPGYADRHIGFRIVTNVVK